jgi:hypothetical protein
MAEYIERRAAIKKMQELKRYAWAHPNRAEYRSTLDVDDVLFGLHYLPAADVVEVEELKEFAEDVIYQFGYKFKNNDGLYLTTGGLSTLESAFAILGWPDPKPFPEGECEWDGCHEYATCGTPTPDGYKRVCCEHYVVIKSRQKDGET